MNRSTRLANMEDRRKVVSANHSVDHRNTAILGIIVHFVFWSSFCLDHVEGTTLCAEFSASDSLPVASLCYQTSASANRVVLDGLLTYQSTTSTCECTLTSSVVTNVNFVALRNIQPNHANCGSNIRVQSGGTTFIINCYVSGSAQVSPTQPVMINFDKPIYGYDSSYCMLLSPSPENSNALLTLNCNGDLNFPTSTQAPPPTRTTTTTTTTTTTPYPTSTMTSTTTSTTTTVTTTTPAPDSTTTTTSTTTPAPTTASKAPTTKTKLPTTTKQPTTTSTTTTMASTTTSTTSSVTSTATSSTDAPSTTYNPTTRSSVRIPTTPQSQSSDESSSAWSYVIPAIGGGLILFFAIVMAACYNHRNKRNNLYHSSNALFAYDDKINSPYYSKNLYEEGPGMTSSLSATAQIKAIIVDDVRDDMSESTNVSEGTFVRHSVRQPTSSEMPVYAVANKSLDAKNLPPDEMSTKDDISANQSKQTTESDVDVIY